MSSGAIFIVSNTVERKTNHPSLVFGLILIFLIFYSGFSGSAFSEEDGAINSVSEESDRIIYQPAFFEAYNPLTASDMVAQIPGFALAFVSNKRGLGQGQGNLLINHKRPNTKSSISAEILSRIAASSVLRIEILQEGSPELAGQSGLIANIITRSSSELTGTWVAQIAAHKEGLVRPGARLSVNGSTQKSDYSAELSWQQDGFREAGTEHAYDGQHHLTELRQESFASDSTTPKINLGLTWTGDKDQIANLSFLARTVNSDEREISERFEADGKLSGPFKQTITSLSGKNEYYYEISGDYAIKLSHGVLKIIGLRRYKDSKYFTDYDDTPLNSSAYTFKSTFRPRESETILRSLFTFDLANKQSLELALEGALNKLNTLSTFKEDSGEGYSALSLSGSNIRLKEERGEASALYSASLRKNLTFQSSLAVEYSKITVDSQGGRSRSYVRPKGFISFNYDPNDKLQIRGRLSRMVGQLNFYDFASTLDILEGTENTGNTELVPQQKWRWQLDAERRFGLKNILKLSLFYEKYNDYLTTIPFENGGEGVGNVDSAIRYGIEVSTSFYTDAIGARGGKLDLIGSYIDSALIDPLTAISRDFDNRSHWIYDISFRQDIPRTDWAWSFSIMDYHRNLKFRRIDQLTINNYGLYYAASIEHKDFFGMTLTLLARNFLDRKRDMERFFYQPDRTGNVTGSEKFIRTEGAFLHLSLSGKF